MDLTNTDKIDSKGIFPFVRKIVTFKAMRTDFMIPTVQLVKCTVHSVQCTAHSVHCTVHSVQCIVHSVQCTVFSVQCTVFSVQCASEVLLLCHQTARYHHRNTLQHEFSNTVNAGRHPYECCLSFRSVRQFSSCPLLSQTTEDQQQYVT